MKVETSAEDFRIEAYTDGYPHWVSLYYKDEKICEIHHQELRAIEFVISRFREILSVQANYTNPMEI